MRFSRATWNESYIDLGQNQKLKFVGRDITPYLENQHYIMSSSAIPDSIDSLSIDNDNESFSSTHHAFSNTDDLTKDTSQQLIQAMSSFGSDKMISVTTKPILEEDMLGYIAADAR